jgi:iron complex transport system substrate-binding protein
MVEIAGGVDCFGDAAKASFRISMEEFVAAAPEIIVVMVCGYDAKRALREMRAASLPGGWRGIPAVANGALFATDANSYFSRPGPRLVEGIALLASLFHPELGVEDVPGDGWQRVSAAEFRAAV